MASEFVHPSADVSEDATIGDGSSVWHLVQIREHAVIGSDCVVGRGAYIGPGVTVGDRTKIQNLAQIYDPAQIGVGVFIGPGVILTNDVYPRSVDVDGTAKDAAAWDAVGVQIGDGASIGARSVVLAGVRIGAWALIGAGSTVIRDVPDHALVVGNPARRVGWVGRAGRRLEDRGDGIWVCPSTGESYSVSDDAITLID